VNCHNIMYSPDNLQLAYCNGVSIRIFDVASKKLLHSLYPRPVKLEYIFGIRYPPDSRHIICNMSDGPTIMFNVSDGNQTLIADESLCFDVSRVSNYEQVLSLKKYIDT
jgi:WD40 repeat protein